LDFDGEEVYFSEEPKLIGKTYAQSLSAYEDSAVLGVQYGDGRVEVNPPADYVIKEGDKIIAVTEDDDTLVVSKDKNIEIQAHAIVDFNTIQIVKERILMLGWNNRTPIIIREMDNYVAKGSFIKVVSTFNHDEDEISEITKNLKNIDFEFVNADSSSRQVIEDLDITSYDSVQILCYKNEYDVQDADAQTLIALLHIRRIMNEKDCDLKIVSEMLDLKNRELAEVAKADDFIVSDNLISLLMSQVSENKKLMMVFNDLFNEEGSEINFKPMKDYIKPGEKVNFYTILESALRKGHTAIGYRIEANAFDKNNAFGIVLNPEKSKFVTFNENDKIIVLSQN